MRGDRGPPLFQDGLFFYIGLYPVLCRNSHSADADSDPEPKSTRRHEKKPKTGDSLPPESCPLPRPIPTSCPIENDHDRIRVAESLALETSWNALACRLLRQLPHPIALLRIAPSEMEPEGSLGKMSHKHQWQSLLKVCPLAHTCKISYPWAPRYTIPTRLHPLEDSGRLYLTRSRRHCWPTNLTNPPAAVPAHAFPSD